MKSLTDEGGSVIPTSTTAAKTATPTSGAVPNFTPTVTMGAPANPMFTGPIPTGATRTTTGYTMPASGSSAATTVVPGGATPARTVFTTIKNADGTTTVVYSDGSIETSGTAKAGAAAVATPERVYAKDTFVNTLKLTFGAAEAAKPYVSKLYDLVSGFYKSGSTEDEALNLAIRAAKDDNAIPEFTDRFKGIFALQDKLRQGIAVTVPTVAEFLAAESKMGEVLTNAGLSDLNNQTFLGDIIGQGKSVLEVGNLISNVFDTIDNAPTALKTDLQTYFPGVDRSSIAKAILTGPEGAAALANKIKGISVQSAAGSQGLTTDLASAQNLANMGVDYNTALTGFGTVSTELPTYQKLSEISGQAPMKSSQAQSDLTAAVLGKSASEQRKLKKLAEEETNRFAGSSGTSRGSFSTGYLNKQASTGAF